MTIAETTPPSSAPHRQPLTLLGLLVGVTLAPLLAYNQTPSATLYNQLLAFAGLGLTMTGLAWGRSLRKGWAWDGVSIALLVMLAAALSAPMLNDLPWSMAFTSAAMLIGALLALQTGKAITADRRDDLLTMFCIALVGAGLLSVAVCFIQIFWPTLADGSIVARSGIAGRAVGNMRQPNHLASLLMWACVASVWLTHGGWFERRLGTARRANVALGVLLSLFVFCVLLSASRTGMIGVGLLAIWGLLDRRLAKPVRWALALTPLMLAVSWGLMGWWTHAGNHAFGAESRLAEGAGSPSRLAILSNAWSLLQRYPWTGSGWGDFNLAWTMTPFPDRPVAFFDHTHNIAMQLLVELGLPLGLLVLGLLLWGLWRALETSHRSAGAASRCAVMLVVMIGLHSVFEYPLWYAYFLLPAAFALGLALVADPSAASDDERARPGHPVLSPRFDLAIAGAAMVIMVPLAVVDYLRVVHIYAPPLGAVPLDARIAQGQASPFFALQADYAAATVPAPGPEALAAARRTGHHLIDVRLMMAWAKSLDAVGETDKARYVVERLKEFRNSAADDFFEECKLLDEAQVKDKPFQCEPPQREYGFKEIR